MRTVTRNRVVIDTDNAIDEANVARVKRVKDQDFEQARQKELQSFKDTGTYVEVPYEGQARHLKQVGAYLEAAG
jgi:hypothetical protein